MRRARATVLGTLALVFNVIETVGRVPALDEMHDVLDDFARTGDHAVDRERGDEWLRAQH